MMMTSEDLFRYSGKMNRGGLCRCYPHILAVYESSAVADDNDADDDDDDDTRSRPMFT